MPQSQLAARPSACHRSAASPVPSLRATFPYPQQLARPRRDPRTVARSTEADSEGQELASAFGAYVAAAGLQSLADRPARPSPLLPPSAAVAAQLDALQRNDWPEPDAGVRVAFDFAQPQHAGDAATAPAARRARSWGAAETWLEAAAFSELLHSPPYGAMLGCDSWRQVSPVQFPSRRHPHRAVVAVEVTAARAASGGALRCLTFTFCLERARGGPLRDAWLTVGVRVGDYAR